MNVAAPQASPVFPGAPVSPAAGLPARDPGASTTRSPTQSGSWVRRWASTDESIRTVLFVVGVGVAVFALVATAVMLTIRGTYAASWFPAAGVSVGAVAISRGRRRRALLIVISGASLLGYLAGGRPLSLAICYAVGTVVEAGVAGGWLGGADRLRLATMRDLSRFLIITAGAAGLAGAVSGGAVWIFIGAQELQTSLIVTVAHATGALVLLPLVMRTPAHPVTVRRWELAGQSVAVLAAAVVIFAPSQQFPLAFLLLVVLVWTGLRLDARSASIQLLIVSAVATMLTVHDRGPFAHNALVSVAEAHQVLQVFLLVCTVMVLALTVSSTQRKAALAQLSADQRFLDQLIETVDVGVLAVDAAGQTMLLNRTLRDMHGDVDPSARAHDPHASQTFALFRSDGVTPLPAAEVPMSLVMTTGDVDGVELTIAPAGLPQRRVVVHGRRIHADDGTLLGGVIAVHDVTALKQHEAELQAAVTALADEREFEAAVMEVVNAGVVACDAAGNVVLRNATQRLVTGAPNVARTLADAGAAKVRMQLADGSEMQLDRSPLHRALAGEDIVDLAVHIMPDNLPARDVIATAKAIHGSDGRLLGAVSAFTDVTAQLAVQAELRESVAFHDALLAATPDLIFIVDAPTGVGVWFSRNLQAMLGYGEQEIHEMGSETLKGLVHPDDLSRLQATQVAARDLADGDVQQMRYRVKASDGSYRWLCRRTTPFNRGEDGTILQLLGVARDVTEAVDAEDRLTKAALNDPLTGLPNRRLLADRLGLALRRTARTGGEIAVLFCDLDGFKNVNDTAGHAAGDRVLVTTADRLRALLRPQDTIARVGGDEFVIILDPTPAASPAPGQTRQPVAAPVGTRTAAALVARRITQALSEPIDLGDSVHVVTVSIGVTFAQAGDQPDDVLSAADSAMYRAKAHGKDRVEVYDSGQRADAAERRRVELILREALDDQATGHMGTAARTGPAISVAYQPIFDLHTQRMVGVEALARLRDAQVLAVAPDVFIPIAEETGLIAPLGHYVLATACGDLARWHADYPGLRQLGVSVNLSARQAGRADLVDTVQDALDRAGIAPGMLTLELTETALTEAGRSTLCELRKVRALGVKIDIDHFGAGHASVRHLAGLPVTGLKLDQSLIAALPGNPTSQMIVRATAGLARDLDLGCVAVGIETDAQLLALPSGLCGQGYLLGHPVAAPEIAARLSADQSRIGAGYQPPVPS